MSFSELADRPQGMPVAISLPGYLFGAPGPSKLSLIRNRARTKAPWGSLDSPAPMRIGILSQGDPTDHALATIASILDKPEGHREPAKAVAEEKSSAPVEADGYSKIGPGPMAAIRFK